MRDGDFENQNMVSRCGTAVLKTEWDFPDAGRSDLKQNGVTTIKIEKVMTKFTEKLLHSYPMAFYYAAMKAMDDRTAAVETALERFLTMETEFHRLFTAFDVAYKNSLKSQLTDTIKQKDDERDHIAYVMERVAKLWGEKLDDQSLAIHGKRVAQVFKDFDFRTTEALVAENAKIQNMEQRFTTELALQADLAAKSLIKSGVSSSTSEVTKVDYQHRYVLTTIMGFDERSRVLSGELHCPQGAYYPVLPDTFLETGDVLVECVEQCLMLAAESLIGIAYHLCRYECLTVCQMLIMFDDLRLDIVEVTVQLQGFLAPPFCTVAL